MTREQMQSLVDRLNETARAYYVEDNPLISDKEWDALYQQLQEAEKETGLVLPDSPTHRVGGDPLSGFEPHRHQVRLWSLDKAQSEETLQDWEKRAQRLREAAVESGMSLPDLQFSVEYKFDGLTVSLIYENGVLVQAATRGNGEVGEGILQQAKTIRTVPLQIPFTGRLIVQGEGIMRLSELEKYNRSAQEPLKNARNAAAGALRNLDPQVTAARKLDVFCYEVTYVEGKELNNHFEMLRFLEENGFKISPMAKRCGNFQEVMRTIREIEQQRNTLDFLTDGAVVKIADHATRRALGYTDKFPRWACAFKYEAEETTTLLQEVSWELGRTGKLTPLGHVEAVELAGVTVKKATLNNWDDILRKRLRVGCRVWIRRSNDVIPEILGRVDEAVEGERDIEKPAFCPACGAPVEERGAHLFCTGSNCKPRQVAALAHFASRDAMDIETFSEKTAAALYDAVNLRRSAQLYQLEKQALVGLPGMGEKKAQNLLDALEKSKTRPLDAFLFALGIPGIGRKTARDLAMRFKTLEALRNAGVEELLQIEEMGEILAANVREFFESPQQMENLEELLKAGVCPAEMEQRVGFVLEGKTLVVTGTLKTMSRQQAEEAIVKAGGKAASGVSKKTSFVVAGESAGSKLEKARTLGIPVLDENTFIRMISDDEMP